MHCFRVKGSDPDRIQSQTILSESKDLKVQQNTYVLYIRIIRSIRIIYIHKYVGIDYRLQQEREDWCDCILKF